MFDVTFNQIIQKKTRFLFIEWKNQKNTTKNYKVMNERVF